mmetsp:Transcript_6613/g.14437  ORF Transcript_6613/g.14437 Transcript_6613/m.14437 type:complete len:271 (-) Transcript_6613:133-945(-)
MQLLRLLSEEEEGGDYSWGSTNVITAVLVSLGAGLATGVGGLVVFAPQILSSVPKATVLAVALAISGGVMLYVSFIEIFVKAQDAIQTKYTSDAAAAGITTVCFFGGMIICVLLEWLVHAIHHRFSPVELDGHAVPAPPPVTTTGSTETATPPVDVEMVRVTQSYEVIDSHAEKKKLTRMGAMTALAIALHNFPEGLATFLATVSDPQIGLALGVAIAVHNIPEGVCVAMPIFYATGSKANAPHPPLAASRLAVLHLGPSTLGSHAVAAL